MAQVSSFVNRSRARMSAFLELMEDMVALQLEFNALGGVTFTNTFDFAGENASTYDMTQAEYTAMLTAIGEFITVYQGGTAPVRAARTGDMYKGKV
jgi:hypothetical protein